MMTTTMMMNSTAVPQPRRTRTRRRVSPQRQRRPNDCPWLASAAAAVLMVLVLVAASGCVSSAKPDDAPPPTVEVSVNAAPRLNPDEQGQSLPTLVRVFQLTGPTKLEGATLEALYRAEKDTLGEQLLQVDELLLSPGESAHKVLARAKDARYLAVVGIFRRPAGLTWRTVVPLAMSGSPQKLQFVLEDYRVDQR